MRDNDGLERMLLFGELFVESGGIEVGEFLESNWFVYDDFGVGLKVNLSDRRSR